nr:hypothetical protein [Mycobacteroides salmoniphilum]
MCAATASVSYAHPAFSAPASASVVISLPSPTGPFPVGVVDLHLVNPARNDPWNPSQPRELMIRLWYPAADSSAAPPQEWMSGGALRSETNFLADQGIPAARWKLGPDHARLAVAARTADGPFPLLAYSPGMISPAGWNTALGEDLASHGYIVAAINHTHEAWDVQFSGGRIESTRVPFDTPLTVTADFLLPIRVADTRFLLDQLGDLAVGKRAETDSSVPVGLAASLDTTKIGMVGDSLGGATTAQAMHDDPRIQAGANLDGPILGSVAQDGLDRPLLMLASGDPRWNRDWPNNIRPKLAFRLTQTEHMSFTDQQLILPQLATAGLLTPDTATTLIGTINPERSIELQRIYIRTFFNAAFAGADPESAINQLEAPEIGYHR